MAKRPDRARITADLERMWLDPTPLPEYRPVPHDPGPLADLTAPALLDLLGREGLEWHARMRRARGYGNLLEVC